MWTCTGKSTTCDFLKLIFKIQQEEHKLSFGPSKCDKIFDELLKVEKIKLSHVMPLLDELKKKAYCKWHNKFSHVMNDFNVFFSADKNDY